MSRRCENSSKTLDSVLADSPEIEIGWAASGEIFIPTDSPITTLTYYVAPHSGGTYIAAYDSASSPAAVTQTVSAAKAYPIPAAVFGSGNMKITTNADGTVAISLKS